MATAAWVAGCSHISVCIAGATTVGTVRQVKAEVTRSSAMPAANLAITLVVAGAMIATSAHRATSTCTMRCTSVKVSVWAGRPVSAANWSGCTNRVAPPVMMTWTSAPAFFRPRASEAAL